MDYLPEELLRILISLTTGKDAERLCISTEKFHQLCRDIWREKISSIAPQRFLPPHMLISQLFKIGEAVSTSGTGYYFGKVPFHSGPMDHKNLLILPQTFIPEPVCQVSCGFSHVAWLSTGGEVYVQGLGESGQLGLPNRKKTTRPQKIPNLSDIIQVSCGDEHTVFLSSGGILSAIGNSLLNHNISNVKQISCGSRLTMYITNIGNLYGFGYNDYDQLGKDRKFDEKRVDPIYLPNKVKQVSCGVHHTLCLLETGQVYAWGRNNSGELGLGDRDNRVFPTPVPFSHRVTQVSAAFNNSAVVTERGKVFIWGDDITIPILVAGLDDVKITQISSGNNLVAMLSDKGEVYLYGNYDDFHPQVIPAPPGFPIKLPYSSVTYIALSEYQMGIIIK